MALASFSDLKTSLAGWLMREDLTGAIPDFITLCEQTINYGTDDTPGLRVADMEKTTTLVPDGNGVVTFPADFLEWRAVDPSTNGYPALDLVSPDYQIGMYPCGGVPRTFTVASNTFKPYPGTTGGIAVTYYAKLPALSDTAPSNWLLAKAPAVYLYGALLHSAPYLGDDARVSVWATLYAKHIGGLARSDVGARYANAKARVRSQTP